MPVNMKLYASAREGERVTTNRDDQTSLSDQNSQSLIARQVAYESLSAKNPSYNNNKWREIMYQHTIACEMKI